MHLEKMPSTFPRIKLSDLFKVWGVMSLTLYCSAALSDTTSALSNNTLAANGEQHTILNISTFGRYAITVHSEQGTGLQLIDRMTGPGPINGKSGQKDGRLDLFLERGEYKIVTHAHEKGSGKLKLAAHSFTERHTASTPRLIELKPVQTRLEDFQQISYWLEIKQRRRVAIEAAGRSLGDLRLWKDGDWLVDTLPTHKTVTPQKGKPLDVYQLNAQLEPGMYLLTLYGGPAQIWSEDSDEQPLHIRYGIPKLSVADRRSRQISPFGIDRWLVPKPANYFRLELPTASDATLRVADYQSSAPFAEGYRNAKIDKTSLPPVVELTSSSGNDYQRVSVEGEANLVYTLQHFEHRYYYNINNEGNFWISTLHSGAGADSVDATSILTVRPRRSKEQLLDTRTVELSMQHGWQRRFNLLDPLTLYLHVPQGGRYQLTGTGEGVAARYKIEPFLTSRPKNYRSPPFKDSGHIWALDPGYYVLSIKPTLKGILNLTIRPEGLAIPPEGITSPSVASGTRYSNVKLKFNTHYKLYLNQQPGVKAGLVLRELPIDLDEGLPVNQRSGEVLKIPVKTSEPGVIRALDSHGQALALSINGSATVKSAQVSAGQYTVGIKNQSQKTISYSLTFEPKRLASNTPLPQIPNSDSTDKPRFPILSSTKPAFLNLAQNQTATYNVKVTKPSLYRLETSGLLSTEGNLRTRTELSLVRRLSNGVGRNFLIQQYLREGDYQLSIKPRGKSQGRTRLSLQQTTLINNGQLTDGVTARFTLPADRGLAYEFQIKEKSHYRLRALGPSKARNIRLEDADGWPIITPNRSGDLEHDFKPGHYRLIIQPKDTASRVISLLEKLPPEFRYAGHGPHALPLAKSVQHLWLEPGTDEHEASEQKDQWNFTLTAPADTRIKLDNEMAGELLKLLANGQTETVAKVSATKVWENHLEGGRYRLMLHNQRNNNRVEYNLRIDTDQLLPGQTREISVPGELSLSLGETSLMELSAFAKGDVRAWLYDDKNQLIAKNDDRADDWNFLIARRLDAGQYRLRIESLGQGATSTRVSLRIPTEKKEAALKLPASRKIADEMLHLFPIESPKGKTLLTVTADSVDTVGITLEINNGSGWQWAGTSIAKKARLLLPLGNARPPAQLRLRLWSVDRRGADIKLRIEAHQPKPLGEKVRTLTLKPLGKNSMLAVAAITVSRPGIFALSSEADLLASGQALQALQLTGASPLAANTGTLWLAAESNQPVKARIKRLSLQTQKPLQMTLPQRQAAYVNVTAGDGPLLVLAESRSGQVGLQLLDKNQSSANHNNVTLSKRGMVSALLSPKQPKAKLWNGGNAGEALETSLRTYRFTKAIVTTAVAGVTDSALPAMSTLVFDLPPGLKHLQMALPAHTAALLSNKGQIERLHWSGDTPLNLGMESHAKRLTLLHAAESTAQLRLEINRLSTQDGRLPAISANRLYRHSNARSGVQQFAVRLPDDGRRYTLRTRGPAKASLLQDDGTVLHGEDLALNASGILQLRHEPGLLMVWLESREQTATPKTQKALTFDVPVTLDLRDDLPPQRLQTQQGVVLHLHSSTPLITRLHHADGAEQVQAYPHGASADIYLPGGETQLSLTSITGQPLSGKLNLSTSPLTEITEGIGPERLLAAGGGQLFSFTLDKSTTVGIGLQASSDLIRGVLMNAKGNIIGRGVVQMMELPAGHYVLAVYAPPEDKPVRIRPVLIGTQPKETAPPKEVIQRYLQAAGVKMSEEKR